MIEVRMTTTTTDTSPALAFSWFSDFQLWATKIRGTSAAKFQVYLYGLESTEGQHLGSVAAALNWLDRNPGIMKADRHAEQIYRELMTEEGDGS